MLAKPGLSLHLLLCYSIFRSAFVMLGYCRFTLDSSVWRQLIGWPVFAFSGLQIW